jgi:hypothetical protein
MESDLKFRRIEGLYADAPDASLKDKLMLFGQFVGDWDILEDRLFRPDGKTDVVQSGELHWGWILDGNALQDVWMFHDKDKHRAVPAGTTIRFYDPKIDAWRSTWITPIDHAVVTFIAQKAGDEIVLEGKNAKGELLKWIFSDIKPDSFKWRGEASKDGGKTWVLVERMQIRRRRIHSALGK